LGRVLQRLALHRRALRDVRATTALPQDGQVLGSGRVRKRWRERAAPVSGKPSQEGVSDMIAKLDQLYVLEDEIEELRPKAMRLQQAREERDALLRALPDGLHAMDVAQNGNTGWEARVTWFLTELYRQIRVAAAATRSR
jgi:hypothetical protein